MKGSCTMPSANGKGAVYIEKILDEELGDKCALYAKVTIPAGSALGYHEHHGNGENYVVGYWNRGDIEFMPTISVILDDAEEGSDVLYLEGVDFGYLNKVEGDVNTITAITFNAAAVEAMAAQAVENANYTGSYAIRITFLPINYDDELEYAITFDSVIAE